MNRWGRSQNNLRRYEWIDGEGARITLGDMNEQMGKELEFRENVVFVIAAMTVERFG